jgi:hypothetical protein
MPRRVNAIHLIDELLDHFVSVISNHEDALISLSLHYRFEISLFLLKKPEKKYRHLETIAII